MLRRLGGYLYPRKEPAPPASRKLEREGYAVIRQAFGPRAIAPLRREILDIYGAQPPDGRAQIDGEYFRYEMFNKSPRAQKMVARREILDVIEPLLGEDCHLIANTCWRNPADSKSRRGGAWHIDAGPHVPRAKGTQWPAKIPYPIFAIGCHIFLEDCPIECGPTGVIPRSHKSGRPPPVRRLMEESLTWDSMGVKPLTAKAGDVALFVSDVWHRRLPARVGDSGRFFLQAHYGRRDIAQRIKPTQAVHHIDASAKARIRSARERRLLGIHPPGFYDG
jgi:hypothetical protein